MARKLRKGICLSRQHIPFLMMFCYFHWSYYLSFDLFSLFYFVLYKMNEFTFSVVRTSLS